jgi:hypothetical protein
MLALSAICFPHLRDLDLVLELALEAREQYLALGGLEAVHDVGDAALVVVVGEDDVLLVDEVGVLELSHLGHLAVVQVRFLRERVEPVLSVADAVLSEDHVNEVRTGADLGRDGSALLLLFALRGSRCFVQRQLGELDLVQVERRKVLLGFGGRRRSETLVVLELVPLPAVSGGLEPLLVLGEREEGDGPASLGHLDDRSDELLQEA